MINFWNSLTYVTKFSTIAFFVTCFMGLLSMGALGAVLYYPVSVFFKSYPSLNDWTGDWVWPVMIGAGMLWSFGFIFSGLTWHYLEDQIHSVILLRLIYLLVLWVWAAIIWYLLIKANVKPL